MNILILLVIGFLLVVGVTALCVGAATVTAMLSCAWYARRLDR